ncbi:MAG: hypothetical protein U1E89_20075 [Burkholderiaceae bacterium]
MTSLDAVIGTLSLRPGREPSLACERPLVGPALLGRLTHGRRAALLPDLLGSLFTLCTHAHRQTARRAVLAACGRIDAEAERRRDAQAIALHTAREHLQRVAIDWPRMVDGVAQEADAAAWLRDAPVIAMASATGAARDAALRDAAAALPGWLERRLFGMAPADWLARWRSEGGQWLERWSTQHAHPAARVLQAAWPRARAIGWPSATLDVADRGESGWRALATAIAADPGFAGRPQWHGAPAETGPWTRRGAAQAVGSAWDRLGARLADLARIAGGAPLDCGALAVAPGEAIAWSEMSRGLLVHWVRLEAGHNDPAVARIERVHVLAPTEWNFHPEGGFARWLAGRRPDGDGPAVRLAAIALDPCLDFTIEPARARPALPGPAAGAA